jgi:hypothetical protein
MIPINLPQYDINLGGTKDNPTIFDILRHRFVALTPEEWVRQHFVHYLVDHLHYPAPLMANEVKLSVGNKKLRADTVLYDRTLRPRMIIEYKAPNIKITRKVFDQILAYNTLLHVEYLVVSNGLSTYCMQTNANDNTTKFRDSIPEYKEL